MGCLQPKGHARIAVMQTMNKDEVFTSTTDIHRLYNFGKLLGIGTFGKVVLAQMKSNTSKQYAIKVIDKRAVKGKEPFLANEIFVLKQLDHPNIIKFHEVYQSELYFYICMDYCQGGELVERLAKQQQILTEGQVQSIIFKICSAVGYIHDKGIVHRDIKPENIMFSNRDSFSEPKLIDFGLANKFDQKHIKKLSTFVGTPLYVPPEIIAGLYDEKCDVWSLGILLYSLLSGYPPFYGKNEEELYEKIKTQEVIFDSKKWANISEQAKDLLKKMLTKNPNKRPSAKECLTHPWFKLKFSDMKKSQRLTRQRSLQEALQKRRKPTSEDNRTIYDMLKNFRGGAKFKKEVTKVLVNQMNEKELQHLKQVFGKIDVDNSGTITVQELRQALLDEGSPASYSEIEQLVQTIVLEEEYEDDAHNDDAPREMVIKYSDFLAACIDERKVLTREKLWSLFKYFDTQNVKYITKEDIKEAFARHGRQLSDDKIESMIYEIDPNHDNKISFDEFCQMMGTQGVEQTMDIKDDVKETPLNSEQDM